MPTPTSTPAPSPAPAGPPPSGPSQRRRVVEATVFVGVWMAAGHLLSLSSNAYLLLGIPLTVAFQTLVRRRPVRELFAAGTSRFGLDRRGAAVAVFLAVVPLTYAVRAFAGDDRASSGRYVAATIGAVCAAFALSTGSLRTALRAAVPPIAVGAAGMAVVYGVLHAVQGTPLPAGPAAVALLTSVALYFPATFVVEEVAFRGAFDAHVHHDGETRGWQPAVLVSALWGVWHLPVTHALPFPLQLAELVVVHIALGVPLSLAWRRTRNLAAPAFAHPVNDAVRNAVTVGL